LRLVIELQEIKATHADHETSLISIKLVSVIQQKGKNKGKTS
jgi:hypothetical protein